MSIFNVVYRQLVMQPLIKKKKTRTRPPQKYNSLKRLVGVTTNCALSAFYYGYCLTYFNAVAFRDIVKIYHIEHFPKALTQGLLTGCISLTGALGSILSLMLVQRYSRRKCLMMFSAIAIVLSLLILVPNIWVLVGVRLVQGLVIGAISCITPLYINEMMPKSVSAPFWSYHQCLHVLGISFGFIQAYLFSKILTPAQYWRIIFAFPIITSVIQICIFYYVYPQQSPKFLIIHEQQQKARETLRFLYKQKYVQRVLQEIIEAVEYAQQSESQSQDNDKEQINEKSSPSLQMAQSMNIDRSAIQLKQITKGTPKIKQMMSLNQMLLLINNRKKQQAQHHSRNNKVALFTALFLSIQQPFLGGPGVINYSGDLIQGIFPNLETIFPIIINITGIFGSLFSIYILAAFGRRDVILLGSASCGLMLFVCAMLCLNVDYRFPEQATILIRVSASILFIIIRVTLAATFSPVSDLYTAEIVQPQILSYCSLAQWLFTAVVTIMFPMICDLSHGNPAYTFILFAAVTGTCFMVNRIVVIESKNKSEIEVRKQYDERFPDSKAIVDGIGSH